MTSIGSFGGVATIGISEVIAAMKLPSSIAGKRKNSGPAGRLSGSIARCRERLEGGCCVTLGHLSDTIWGNINNVVEQVLVTTKGLTKLSKMFGLSGVAA